jgi:FecR protein
MLILVAGTFLAAVSTPVWADTPARPGTVNYVEGQAAMGGQSLDAKSHGAELGEGQSITTLTGKVEILLTPGVFLRLGPNSSLKMVAAGLTDTEVQLEQGRAMIEVDQIFPENHLRVMQGSFAIDLQKKGLYDFDATRNQVRVFDGEALATESGHRVELKGGHELNLAMGADVKSHGFDKKAFEDDLYNWSRLRSSYLAEANITQARVYAGGPGFFGAGWYWNPWYSAYTFIPGDGFFYNPFGWGFYSPWFVYRAPFFGFYGGYRTFGHYAPPAVFVGGYRGGVVASAHFSPAPAFHSMGGGFHGGRR